MARLLITGASGYIGKRLCAMARAEGHQVVALGRATPGEGLTFFSWSLGEPVPGAALAGADALIHLAHSWATDAKGGDLNQAASESLAREALAAGVPRFVFASTNSARPGALNAYGRAKYAIEGRLAALPGVGDRLVSARIALVYGGPPSGQYAMMRKITALTPVLPMLGLDRQVQPIHLDEVCHGLLTLALRRELTDPFYVIGGEPISFARWLKILRKVQTGGGLVLIPLPLKLMLLACDIFPFLPKERVLGLAAAEPMDSRESLKALNIVPADPLARLQQEEAATDGGEARALLRYLGAMPTATMERDLSAGLERAGLSPLGLSPLLLKRPGLIALVEPPANRQANHLAQALHLASQVIEAQGVTQKRPHLVAAGLLVACDLLTLPLRIFTSRRYQ